MQTSKKDKARVSVKQGSIDVSRDDTPDWVFIERGTDFAGDPFWVYKRAGYAPFSLREVAGREALQKIFETDNVIKVRCIENDKKS